MKIAKDNFNFLCYVPPDDPFMHYWFSDNDCLQYTEIHYQLLLDYL